MLLPKKGVPRPSQTARQDATAPRNMYRSTPSGPEANTGVRMLRKALPINVAMMLQDFAGNKLPLTKKDLSNAEINALRGAARDGRAEVEVNLLTTGENHNKLQEDR